MNVRYHLVTCCAECPNCQWDICDRCYRCMRHVNAPKVNPTSSRFPPWCFLETKKGLQYSWKKE